MSRYHKSNSVAIVTDDSAVLALGILGAEASLVVMESKAMLFGQFRKINAFSICLVTQNTDKIAESACRIVPFFEGD